MIPPGQFEFFDDDHLPKPEPKRAEPSLGRGVSIVAWLIIGTAFAASVGLALLILASGIWAIRAVL